MAQEQIICGYGGKGDYVGTNAGGSGWGLSYNCFSFLSDLHVSANFMVAWHLVGSPTRGDVLDRRNKHYPVPGFFFLSHSL